MSRDGRPGDRHRASVRTPAGARARLGVSLASVGLTVFFAAGGAIPALAVPQGQSRPAALAWRGGPRLGGRGDYPDALAFSPNGKVLATADSDGTARLWDVATGHQIGAPVRSRNARVLRVAFSPNGKVLATAGIGGSARLWDVATGHQIGAAMTPGGGAVQAVTFSPNGKILATDTEFKAQLWNVRTHRQTGKPIGTLAPVDAAVLTVAFSPDSKILATAGNENGEIRLWNVATHRRIGTTMSAGLSDAYGVAFTPDGKDLVTTDTDGTIRLWDVATHHQIGAPTAPKGAPEFLTAALSPDGKILATTQFQGPGRLWELSAAKGASAADTARVVRPT